MEFETFRGKDVQEVMAAVKAAYGPNAWIGPTRHLSNGKPGGLGQRLVEVKAAPMGPGAAESRTVRPEPRMELLGALANRRRAAAKAEAPPPPSPDTGQGADRLDDSVTEQLEAIRMMVEELHAARTPKERVAGALDAARFEGSLAGRLARGGATAARKGNDALRAWLRNRVAKEIAVAPDPLEQQGRRIVMCVGPTGVGKTTTIAKLAARAHLEMGRQILLLTLDTYRVGSVPQIERFANLMGAPFRVLREPADFCDAMLEHPADVVFVDTASRPPTDGDSARRVAGILDAAPDLPLDILLVLPAMTQGRDAERIARSYRLPKPTGLVISKLDETDRAGGALHANIHAGLPVVYLSTGPRVPEDLEAATVGGVLDTVFPEQP